MLRACEELAYREIDTSASLAATFLRQIEGAPIAGVYELHVAPIDRIGCAVTHAALTNDGLRVFAFVRDGARQSSLRELGAVRRTGDGYEVSGESTIVQVRALTDIAIKAHADWCTIIAQGQMIFSIPSTAPSEDAVAFRQLLRVIVEPKLGTLRLVDDNELIKKAPRIFVDGTNVALDERSPYNMQRQPDASVRTLRAVKHQLLRLGYAPIIFYDESYARHLTGRQKEALLLEIAPSPPHRGSSRGQEADELVLDAASSYGGDGLDARFFVALDKYEDWRPKYPRVDFAARQMLVHWVGPEVRFQTEGTRWDRQTGSRLEGRALPRAGPSLL